LPNRQLGLERTPEEYVASMVDVFRGVRRVLRDDGTLWLNLGDSYARGGRGGGTRTGYKQLGQPGQRQRARGQNRPERSGLKPKDLVGIPWRVAFALQADGWYLRSDIIWAKPNPMPESVTDRPTKAHEYLFLLTKQPSGTTTTPPEDPARHAHQGTAHRTRRPPAVTKSRTSTSGPAAIAIATPACHTCRCATAGGADGAGSPQVQGPLHPIRTPYP
jgi:hypothetical protein